MIIPSDTFSFSLYYYEIAKETIPTGFLWTSRSDVYTIRRIFQGSTTESKPETLYKSYSLIDGDFLFLFSSHRPTLFEKVYFSTLEEAKNVIKTARNIQQNRKPYQPGEEVVYSTKDEELS